MKRLFFIINPISGTKDKNKILNYLKDRLQRQKLGFEFALTSYPHHAKELAKKALEDSYDAIVAVGGDGTAHDVGTALIDKKTPLGIIPIGSANGLARELGISLNYRKAIDSLLRFNMELIDTVKINETSFLGTAGIGYDAYIAWKAKNSKKRGLFNYAKLIFKELLFYKSQAITLTIDDVFYEWKAFIVTFANIRQYGGGALIAPQANPQDGYLDVILAKPHPFYAIPKLTYQLMKGTLYKSPYTEMIRCKKVVVHNSKKLAGHIDGDPIEFQGDVCLAIAPRSLKILVP